MALAYDDLRDWIKRLDKAGELKRVSVEVDPILEMAEIADRTLQAWQGNGEGGRAGAAVREGEGVSGRGC